ncbi:MAG: hypothetical protein V3V37_08710 [Candidatus Adiutricales bacterium]
MKRFFLIAVVLWTLLMFTGSITSVLSADEAEDTITAAFYAKATVYTCARGHEHIDFLKEDFDALMAWISVKCGEECTK